MSKAGLRRRREHKENHQRAVHGEPAPDNSPADLTQKKAIATLARLDECASAARATPLQARRLKKESIAPNRLVVSGKKNSGVEKLDWLSRGREMVVMRHGLLLPSPVTSSISQRVFAYHPNYCAHAIVPEATQLGACDLIVPDLGGSKRSGFHPRNGVLLKRMAG